MGEAFSAGIGLALGLAMTHYMFQAFRMPEKAVRQVILCPRCGRGNPVENRFCWECGNALYPPPPIHCPKCGVPMPQNINFCRRCGSPLRKAEKG
jgi:predicted amidophosphoribosyltransferase